MQIIVLNSSLSNLFVTDKKISPEALKKIRSKFPSIKFEVYDLKDEK